MDWNMLVAVRFSFGAVKNKPFQWYLGLEFHKKCTEPESGLLSDLPDKRNNRLSFRAYKKVQDSFNCPNIIIVFGL